LKYYRYLEHVGIGEDFDRGYRSKDEFLKWYAVDPIALQRKKLIEKGCQEEEIQKIETDIDNQINNSIKLAKSAPFADECILYENVFA
jgi:pyruvate dehydrogenase E1 component alpha subunit